MVNGPCYQIQQLLSLPIVSPPPISCSVIVAAASEADRAGESRQHKRGNLSMFMIMTAAHKSGVKKINIVNCHFHKPITYHVTVLISGQFVKSWLDHFPLAKLAKCEVYVPEKKPYIKWEKARKPLSNSRKWANFLPRNHVTDGISEQVSDFCLGHRKWLFWSEEKQ